MRIVHTIGTKAKKEMVIRMNIKHNNGVLYLTPEFASFKKVGDFLGLDLLGDTEKLNESVLELKKLPHYDRVKLRRAFPFELAERYISVLDTNQNEIGLIENLDIFPESDKKLIRDELERVYFCREIKKVNSVKERLGYAYFNVVSDAGELEIPLKDVQRSMIHVGDDKIIIIDTDGNRYNINSLRALDKKSKKKLELYV